MKFSISLTFVLVVGFGSAYSSIVCAVPVTGGTGPGGFLATGATSDLTLWLRGDVGLTQSGSDVTNWNDQSGHANHFSQTNGPQQPDQTTTLNGVPVVTFDGGSTAAPDTMISTGSVVGRTIFVANRPTSFNGGCCNPVVGNQADYVSIRFANGSWNFPGDSNDFPNPAGSEFRIDNVPTNVTVLNQAHVLTAVRGGGSFTFSRLQLAQHNNGVSTLPGRNFGGDIAEVAIFNRVLNAAESILVSNNLSSKFALPLTVDDYYSGDSPGIDYDSNVFGVGRVDASNQVVSAGSAGFGIEVVAGINPNELNTGEFILAGHNAGTPTVMDASSSPEIVGERWSRVWNIDTNGGATDATLSFNFDDAGLGAFYDSSDNFQLLYSTTADFSSFEILSNPFSIQAGDVITFNIAAADLVDGFYTLGINVSMVPEPSTAILLLSALAVSAFRRKRLAKESMAA